MASIPRQFLDKNKPRSVNLVYGQQLALKLCASQGVEIQWDYDLPISTTRRTPYKIHNKF